MDRTALEGRLIAVLCQIQGDSGPECPPLTGATKPFENLPKFESRVWPVAPAIHAKSIKEPQAPRSACPARTADIGLALQTRHPRDPVRYPAGRQDDEARAVGDRMQAPPLFFGLPADTAVARGPA